MKRLTIITAFFAVAGCLNQAISQETRTISKKKILPVEAELKQRIGRSNDTTHVIVLDFKDARYPSIDEHEYITLRDQSDIDAFVKGLTDAIAYMETADKGASKTFSGKTCSFYVSGNIILMSTDGPHTTMMKGAANKIIAWLKATPLP